MFTSITVDIYIIFRTLVTKLTPGTTGKVIPLPTNKRVVKLVNLNPFSLHSNPSNKPNFEKVTLSFIVTTYRYMYILIIRFCLKHLHNTQNFINNESKYRSKVVQIFM